MSWKLQQWKSVLEIKSGRSQKQVKNQDGKYPIYGSGGIMGYADDFICNEGTTIIGRKGTINKPIYVEEKFWNVDTAFGLSPSKYLDSKFLYYFCLGYDFTKHDKGTTLPSLVKKDLLANVFMAVPPIAEQRRIVEILDEAFEGIDRAEANTKKNLANARELFDSYLNKVFNNSKNTQWVTLSDLCVAITDGDHQPPPKASEGIPFITISNIDKQNRTIDFSDTFKVSPGYFNKLKEHRRPLQGDILYTVTGSYGIPVIVNDEKKFCFQRHIGLIRPSKETKSRFLYYLLLSEKVKKQADKCATGTAQKTVGLRSLRKFIVPKMSLNDQIEIIKKLDDTSKEVIRLEKIYQRKLEALAELKQSILQKAFTGKLPPL